VNRCAVVPAVAATDASSIHGTLHDASERPWPVGPAREPHSTEATTVASTPRVDGQTGESVDPNGRVHPADGAGQESRGGDFHAWTGPTGAARPSGRPHASPVVWPAAARTSTILLGRDIDEGRVRSQLASKTASSGRDPWYLARAKALSVGLSNAYFKSPGLPSVVDGC